ncbi:unnamed protein product [Trichobilharzia szidati]|nr:unnamed protein product [Trichobilharzia szidati]
MSAPNIPNNTIRHNLFDVYRPDYPVTVPIISQAPTLGSAPRNVFTTYSSNPQSRSVQKSTVNNSMSNFSLVTTSNITQQNANNTANHPTFNNLFQSLLSYVNTIASGQNGNLFTSFRPAQLTYQSNNIRITLPTSVSLVSPHVTVNSNALRSSNPTSSHNNMNNGTQSTITTTAATAAATTTTKTTTATTTGRFSKAMSTESLFVSTNLIPCNGMKKLGAMTFLRWAAGL